MTNTNSNNCEDPPQNTHGFRQGALFPDQSHDRQTSSGRWWRAVVDLSLCQCYSVRWGRTTQGCLRSQCTHWSCYVQSSLAFHYAKAIMQWVGRVVAEASDDLFPDYLDSAHTVPFLVLRLNIISSSDIQKQQGTMMPSCTHMFQFFGHYTHFVVLSCCCVELCSGP